MLRYYNFCDRTELKETVQEHIIQWMKENPGGKIVVGTDSSEFKRSTLYATVIALFFEGQKGAHLIYTKRRDKKRTPLISRLWEEVNLTFIVLEEIKNEIGIIGTSHIDINCDEEWDSNVLYAAAMGFFKGNG